MVKIQIDEKYYLYSDKYQWKIGYESSHKDKKGNDVVKEDYVSYHKDIGSALESYLNMKQRTSDANTWEGLMEVTRQVKEVITDVQKRMEL